MLNAIIGLGSIFPIDFSVESGHFHVPFLLFAILFNNLIKSTRKNTLDSIINNLFLRGKFYFNLNPFRLF